MTGPSGPPALGYYWGDDSYLLERAAAGLGARLAAAAGVPLERWQVRGDQATAPELVERVGTSPMFGGGTLVIVTDPSALLRSEADRVALEQVVRSVALGNALAFLTAIDGSGRESARLAKLRESVASAGGEVREIRAPREGQMARWIDEQARERGMHLEPGAGQELATRIGAFVREGDVDRRRQGFLAVGELEKLHLYRGESPVSVEDVRALVPEAIPGSTWALLDAVAVRNVSSAATLIDRLADITPGPVLLTVLHRRIRELLIARDLRDHGGTPATLMRALNAKSAFPAQKLSEQAPNWSIGELERALDGLLELDAAMKGGGDAQATEGQVKLAFAAWLGECVARRPS